MLYPLKLEPAYKPRIWGGRTLADLFSFDFPQEQTIGEVWAIADYPPDSSKVGNGFLAGKTLSEVLLQFPEELTGYTSFGNFPILIKFLDATDKLSIQVHPDETVASRFINERGKAEMWYVLQAGPQAEIIYGLKPEVDKQVFLRAIEEETIVNCVNTIKVKAGDVFYIPPGMVHALGQDVVVAEVQQNSDTTYRIYDYNRLDSLGQPRELHLEKALEAIDFALQPCTTNFSIPLESRHFRVDLLHSREVSGMQAKEMQALLILQGKGEILYRGKRLPVEAGNGVIIPAELERVSFEGEFQALRSRLGAKITSRRINRREPRAGSKNL